MSWFLFMHHYPHTAAASGVGLLGSDGDGLLLADGDGAWAAI